MTKPETTTYRIYDSRDRVYLPQSYKTYRGAVRAGSKLDVDYGGYRYLVHAFYANQPPLRPTAN